jgi:putative transposase
MDFISDALANGRRIKVLTIVDDFTTEFVDLVAEHGVVVNSHAKYGSSS